MPELGPYGSVRGALSNERPYRDLRNVVANYPFESSCRFPGIQPNSGHRDYSRLSCAVGIRSSGQVLGSLQACRQARPTIPNCGHSNRTICGFRQKMMGKL